MDSDDKELLDVRIADTEGFSGIHSRSSTITDPRMYPKDLPECLQPLLKGLAEDLNSRESEGLAAAIYEYRYVFSSGPANMGRTDLVTHMIDTMIDMIDMIEHRPIRLTPRWHPAQPIPPELLW